MKIVDQIITNFPEDQVEAGLVEYDQLSECLPIYMLQRRSKEERDRAVQHVEEHNEISLPATAPCRDQIYLKPKNDSGSVEEDKEHSIIDDTDDSTVNLPDTDSAPKASFKDDDVHILDICVDDKSERDLIKEMQMIMMLGKEMSKNNNISSDELFISDLDSESSVLGGEYTDQELVDYFNEQCADIKNDVMKEFVETDETIIT